MKNYLVVPASTDHIFFLANNMVEEGRRECAALGLGPYKAIEAALKYSVAAWTAMKMPEARPVCMFGVIPQEGFLGETGSPWFMSTEELYQHKIRFCKECSPYVKRMLELFPVLVDYVDARTERGAKWLRWMGFTTDGEEIPYGPFGLPFYKFEMTREWTQQH
jgi:hypothetical protein